MRIANWRSLPFGGPDRWVGRVFVWVANLWSRSGREEGSSCLGGGKVARAGMIPESFHGCMPSRLELSMSSSSTMVPADYADGIHGLRFRTARL